MADFQSGSIQEKLLKLREKLGKKALESKFKDVEDAFKRSELNKSRVTSKVTGDNFILKGKPKTVSSPKVNFKLVPEGIDVPAVRKSTEAVDVTPKTSKAVTTSKGTQAVDTEFKVIKEGSKDSVLSKGGTASKISKLKSGLKTGLKFAKPLAKAGLGAAGLFLQEELNPESADEKEMMRIAQAKGLIPFKEGMAASSEEAIENDQTNEVLKSMAGLPSKEEINTPQVVKQDAPQEPTSKMPALIQRSLKKDTVKTSKALDQLQEGVTGEKVDKSNKMSDDMKTALLAGLPILLGGLLGGSDGLGAGADAAISGLKAKTAAEREAAKNELAQKKIDADTVAQKEGIAVQREAIASKERIAGVNRSAKLLGLKQQSEQKILENTVPNVGVALNDKDAQILKEKKITLDNVTQGIDRLNEIGNRNLASLSPEQRTAANTELQSLIGQLRIPLTGPGPMTDTEREFVEGIIGNPTKIFSLSSNEKVKLDTIRSKFIGDFKNEADSRTIEGLQRSKIKEELKRRGL